MDVSLLSPFELQPFELLVDIEWQQSMAPGNK
jgi:hypothetical protein